MGIFAGIIGLATLGGPVIGGAVVQGLAWQWIFWLNVPIGIALIPLTRRQVAVFAGWERRTRSPLVPVGIFPNGPFVSASASGFLMTGAMFGSVFFLAEYLQAGMGEGPLAAGARMLPLTATLFLVAPVAGRLAGRLGERPIVVAGLLAQAAGLGWMALGAGAAYPALVPAMVLAGMGISAALPAAQNAAVGAVPREAIGVASGVFNTMRQLGGTFGIAIASVVFGAYGGFASPATVSHGFRAALTATAVISAAGALAGFGLRARTRGVAPAVLQESGAVSVVR